MVALKLWQPDKQVVLKFYGALHQPELTVEVQIFRGSDRNQLLTAFPTQISTPPELATLVKTHWHKQYRSYLGKGRAIKILDVEIEPAVTRHTFEQSRQDLDTEFNQWLTTPSFQPIHEALLRYLDPQDQIQVLIQSNDATLRQLPWPSWQLFKGYPQSVVVQSSLGAKELPDTASLLARSRLRILGIFGSNDGIDTEPDKQLLKALPKALVDVVILDQPDRAQINDQLWEQRWDIIVFAGHGNTTLDGRGVLYLNEQDEVLELNDLWYGLRKAVNAGLQLVLFNACAGLGLLARNLDDDVQIPHMIVMRDLVPDGVAQAFLRYFLGEFTRGQSIAQAAQNARDRLESLEKDYPCAQWLPVIWQNPYAVPFGLAIAQSTPPPRSKRLLKVAGGLLVGAIAVWGLCFPASGWLYRRAKVADARGNFRTAQRQLQIAAMLNPWDCYSRYLLGFLHEEVWGDVAAALQWHEAAMELGMPEAIAEYVRLRLLQAHAEGSPLSELDYTALAKQSQLCIEQTLYPETTGASCLKNQGWISMERELWERALDDLEAAIALNDESPHAHCLLAQTLEHLGQRDRARLHWQKTEIQGDKLILEQDFCLRLADQRPP